MKKIGGRSVLVKSGEVVAALAVSAGIGILAYTGAVYLVSLVNDDTLDALGRAKMVVIASLLSTLFVLLLISFAFMWRRINLFKYIGVALLFVVGAYGYTLTTSSLVVSELLKEEKIASQTATVCTTPEQQYTKNKAAIVPIVSEIGSGTGFVIDDEGTVLTAYHVIDGANKVYSGDTSEELVVLKTLPELDLALLKVEGISAHFELTNKYKPADRVIAYGYPGNAFDVGTPSVSSGVVSRVVTSSEVRQLDSELAGLEVIQTDAAINPGNSGGPLIGSCGVVGVIWSLSDTAQLNQYLGVVSEQGIGYAVSAKTAARTLDLPINSGD